ncbi:Baculoviral IAP repeat-containing protein 3, partial [Trachymyrmex cornetzi]
EDIFRVPDDDFSAIISSEDEQIDIPFHPVISTDLVTLYERNPSSCCICLSTDAIYVFVPCGHLCICNDCVGHLEDGKCPLCRETFSTYIRTIST